MIKEKVEWLIKIINKEIFILCSQYINNKKDLIRSRLPYHIIGFIDHDNPKELCSNSPLINLLNIENKYLMTGIQDFNNIEKYLIKLNSTINEDELNKV